MNYFLLKLVEGVTLSGTNSNSYTPAVESDGNTFRIVWQQVSSSNSSINYTTLTRQTDGTYLQGSMQSMSSGYPWNGNPSLIAGGGGARVCWISDDPYESSPVAIFHDPGYYVYWYFGYNVTSTHVNKSPDVYVVGWANGDGTHEYTNSSHLSNPQPLTSTGGYIQIANSGSSSTMRSLGFNTASSPYRFNMSSNIPLYKSNNIDINRGRGGIITLNNNNRVKGEKAQVTFLFGDITAGGEKVAFVDIPDSVIIEETSKLNSYLETKPFALNDDTPFSYNVHYWTNDSSVAVEELAHDKKVAFTVELIDASSNAVIGELKKCEYTSVNVIKHQREGYDVDTKGIGSRIVKLRALVQTNGNATYAVVNKMSNGSLFGKNQSSRMQIGYQGMLAVTEYAIEQNYPNPFNPTTTISYALPQDGMTTLKIYDALGREVKTLVNEFKTTGRYTAEFDASKLSSGVYIYKLVSDKYSSVKKMLLVK